MISPWNSADLTFLKPELWLLCSACVILLLDLVSKDQRKAVTHWLSLLSLGIAAILVLAGGVKSPQIVFSGMYVVDQLSGLLKFGSACLVGLVLIYGRQYFIDRSMLTGEVYVLSLFGLLGMFVMTSAFSFLTLYMGLELLSLSLYAMVALRKDDSLAIEASMKYFILGALASGMLLYGMSMLYGATGSLHLSEVSARIAQGQTSRDFLVLGLIFIVAGIAFKLGTVPFHMWVPDVYQGAPTPITMLIGSAPKLAAVAFVIRLLVQGLPAAFVDWQSMLIVLSVASIVVGNVAAIAQQNIKRMLAYSTISHMGFMLLGLIAGDAGGVAASIFYALVYSFTTISGFGILLSLTRTGFESDNLANFKGLVKRSPWLALMMLMVMFSMAGIPAFVGFFAKLSVISAIVSHGFVWLAVLAVAFSLIGAFYYLRVVKVMFFDDSDLDVVDSPFSLKCFVSVNALLLLVAGLIPQPFLSICADAVNLSLLG
ncbi:NADH-quinone oxidoreductase subunit NuoN [Parachitinimonas caeni]|uniref:NADH-quinone oxidoreductase subunit N n=1 Tax=Parachitinimonas caeni TaxID=3031301 RepID=A0ABT7E1M9_9NEIS|nr:NADH-quinone oxidoreductase subunit NuoN [Parachitinimonas caeni]MDK2124812.1 NADH-quinone oxidoreductase subunit NuoN [Parachitinimonas caeni]